MVAAPVPVTAFEWRKLSTGALFSDVTSTYEISPNGRSAVFLQDQTVNGSLEVFSVLIDGTAPQVALSGLLSPASAVTGLRISPDGNTVVYSASQDTPGVWELYSVPITGGLSVKLNGELAAGGNASGNFQVSPAGDRVVYLASSVIGGVFESRR
jgi:Tol biopolymer transport system component